MKVAHGLREALQHGDGFGELYADDARLDASVLGARRRATGPHQIAAILTELFPGPGRLVEWAAKEHPAGVAAWLERVHGEGQAVRQRHYLHVQDRRIARHWIYAAPPRTGAGDGRPAFPLAQLPERSAEVVGHEVMASTGWSGSRIERLRLADGRALIAKRVVPGVDWLGRATGDPGREGLMFATGTFDRMPPDIDHAIVSAHREDGAWWVLMRDVSAELLPDGVRLSRADNRRVLRSLNDMWETFWGQRPEGLASQRDRIGAVAPRISEIERAGLDLLPKQFEAAWEAFAAAVEPDVADPVLQLVDEPAPLCAALDRHGTTLLHGDVRDEQLGLTGDRLVLLDWGIATQGHPAIEYAWYLMHCGWRIDATHDELWEDFRAARAERDDPEAIQLGFLSGLVMYGWILGHSAVVHPDPHERAWATAELDWWVPRARGTLERASL